MNGLKKVKDLKMAEFLAELKKTLGDKYNKADEERYKEYKDTFADKPAGVAIRQIAEQFRYLWETTGIFINAKEAPSGRRGGEGIQAFFVTEEGESIIGFMYGTGVNPFEQFHKYSLKGREIPNRGTHRIINYNDEGEVDTDHVVELLKKATVRIDDLFKPDNVVAGGIPSVVVGKVIPFVNAEPQWPTAEEREPGQQVRPTGEQALVQFIGGKLQPVFNGTVYDGGKGRVRIHVRAVKAGRPPLEWFFSDSDLQTLLEELEKGSDISTQMAQLIGNQGAIIVGSLYRVERVSQPDGTEVVYRDMDVIYAIPDEEASAIELPQPQQRSARAGSRASSKSIETDILIMMRSFEGKMKEEDLALMAYDEQAKQSALKSLIEQGKVAIKTEGETKVYTLTE